MSTSGIISELENAGLMKRLAEDPQLWWVVVGIDGAGKAVVTSEGGTTLDDMKDNLSDDLLLYGCFKVLGVDTKVRNKSFIHDTCASDLLEDTCHMSYYLTPPLPPKPPPS